MIWLIGTLLVMLYVSRGVAYASEASQNTLLFSIDDEFCRPFLTHLTGLHRKNPKAAFLTQVADNFFAASPYRQPQWLTAEDANTKQLYTYEKPALEVEAFTKSNLENAPDAKALMFADTVGNGEKRLVRVKNFSLGSFGDYMTDILFLRQGFAYNKNLDSIESIKSEYAGDQANVEVDVSSMLSGVQFPSFPEASAEARSALEILKGDSHPQFPFTYKGRLQIFAGALEYRSIVYHLSTGGVPEIACLLFLRGNK